MAEYGILNPGVAGSTPAGPTNILNALLNELSPELIDYIYRYESRFMTPVEKKADRSVRVNTEGIGEKMLAFIISKGGTTIALK